MKLIFDYPETLDSLDVVLATKAYEEIWQQDGTQIIELFKKYTGLEFQQEEIHVIVHDGQSWSGMDGKPMRLNLNNKTQFEKRNALIHELAHRLLFGNDLYAPESEGPDGDELRVFLFQGDVLRELYGEDAYQEWLNPTTSFDTVDHIRLVGRIKVLSEDERAEQIAGFIKARLPSD